MSDIRITSELLVRLRSGQVFPSIGLHGILSALRIILK